MNRILPKYATFILIIICSFFFVSCNSTTKPVISSLSGSVILINDTDDINNDPLDYSGVTVALYHLAYLDTTIVRLNNKYPHIGVRINQETEFDHRTQQPYRQVNTDSEGLYVFDNISEGLYNLAFLKTGWGKVYRYYITVNEGENQLRRTDQSYSSRSKQKSRYDASESETVYLYPVRNMASITTNQFLFEKGRTYYFSNNSSIVAQVSIEPGATIAIAPQRTLDFLGSVQIQNGAGFWRITSMYSLDRTAVPDSIIAFQRVRFLNSALDIELSHLILDNAHSGLRIERSNCIISNTILRRTLVVAGWMASQQSQLSEVLIYNNKAQGIYTDKDTSVDNSIFHSNRVGITHYDAIGAVRNSYFSGNYIGARTFLKPVTFANNGFADNSFALAPCASDPSIEYNEFYYNEVDIELNGYWDARQYYCNPQVTNNNFLGEGFYVHCRGRNSMYGGEDRVYTGISGDKVFPNNYLVASDLRMHIYDRNYPGRPILSKVTFHPRTGTRIIEAGIKW